MNETLPSGAVDCERSTNMWVASVSPSETVIGVDPFGVTQKSWCMPIA